MRHRRMLAAVAALALAVTGLTTTVGSPAQAAISPTVGAPVAAGDFGAGFPSYYTDTAGTSLALCPDAKPNCPVINDPTGGFAAPAGEAFYYTAFASILTGGTTVDGFPSQVDVTFSVGAAFFSAAPSSQRTFQRMSVFGGAPEGNYILEHPYGETPVTSKGDLDNGINVVANTGCLAVPCNFGLATEGPITDFLRAVNPAAPIGYLGDDVTDASVTGATAMDGTGAAAVPRNLVRLRNLKTGEVFSSDKFVITGKLAGGPAPSLSATTIDFGDTASATRPLLVKNIGDQPLVLGSPTGLGGTPFSVLPGSTCTSPVAPGGFCKLDLAYASAVANAGADKVFTMTTNTINGSKISVRLRAASLPAASVTGSPLAFGPTKVGTPAAARTVTLSNTGVAPMAVGAATATGPFTASSDCAASLAVGAACSVSATYTATVLGAESGTLTIAHPDASGGSTRVDLTGNGTVPNASLSAAALEFGDLRPGLTSPVQTLRLTNAGDAAMVVGKPAATGKFAIESTDCPATLAPAAFCRVAVTFRPTGFGSAPGGLTLPNDATPGGSAIVALHGDGKAVAPAAPSGVTAVRGNAAARVSWVASDDGGRAITAYDVFALASTGGVRTVRVLGSARSQVIGTLTNGRPYRFQVRAITDAGAGPRSALTAAVVPSTTASAPRIGTATSGKAGGRATATASWLAPRTSGGARVTSYRVVAQRMSTKGKVLKTTTSGAIKPAARSAALRLRAGTYRFRVVAVNVAGRSALSAKSNVVRAR